jgi:hypothetical protein
LKYQQGRLGRVFVVRFDHEEDLILNLKKLITTEDIRAGMIFFLGALENGHLVVGPERVRVPPVPVWTNFTDGREVMGIGTIFWEDEEPNIHIHISTGRGKDILLGCLRKESGIYLVIEAVILEMLDIKARKEYFDEIGISMLEFEEKKEEVKQ